MYGRLPPISVVSIAVLLATTTATGAQTDSSNSARRTPIVKVFEKTRDAVVNIAATQVFETTVPSGGPFDQLFGLTPNGPRTERYTSTSLGSGFVIHPDGYVVTNAHMVIQAATQKVIFADKTEYEAEVIAIDEKNDLAVLKIETPKPAPAITLGRSDDLMVGETVIAIGNPLGYQHTVTAGIISAVNRSLRLKPDATLENLIQTDASINRGNSGGPLLNALGELIGINTAIRGDAQNIGFAIPVDTLRKVLPEMLSIERLKRLEVGLRLSWRGKVYVVESRGPAAKAGIEPGDELLSVNDTPIHQDVDFHIMMLRATEASPLKLKLKREGKLIKATVEPRRIPIPDGARLMRQKFGLDIRPLTKRESEALDLGAGLIITNVVSGSSADRTGLEPGWIVVQIGKYRPSDLDEVGLILEHIVPGDQVSLRLWQIRRRYIRVYAATLVAR